MKYLKVLTAAVLIMLAAGPASAQVNQRDHKHPRHHHRMHKRHHRRPRHDHQ